MEFPILVRWYLCIESGPWILVSPDSGNGLLPDVIKPLLKTMLVFHHLDHKEQTSLKFKVKCKIFLSTDCKRNNFCNLLAILFWSQGVNHLTMIKTMLWAESPKPAIPFSTQLWRLFFNILQLNKVMDYSSNSSSSSSSSTTTMITLTALIYF